MSGLPQVQVLLDNGTGTFPYDITTKARIAYGLNRGRQDEQAQVTPGQLALILDNNDGRFTLGSTIIAAPSPIRVDQRVRVKVTPGSNLLSADASSFETGTGGWAFSTLLGARTLGTSLAQSAVRATDGTKSLLATWSTTASGNTAGLNVTTVIGQVYTFAVDVYVPTGSPNVRATVAFLANGAFVTTKDAWVRTSVTFTATSTSHFVAVECLSATAGQTCFIDSAMVNAGRSADAFVVGGTQVTRYTGYVQQWPVEWPDGSDLESLVQVLATDAQARLERWPFVTPFYEYVLAKGGAALYPLATGVQAVATTGGTAAADLAYANPLLVATFGSSMSDGLAAASPMTATYPPPELTSTGAVSIAFQAASAPAADEILFVDRASPGRQVLMNTLGQMGTPGNMSTISYADDLPHLIHVDLAGSLYVDNVLITSSSVPTGLSWQFGPWSGLVAMLFATTVATRAADYAAFGGWAGDLTSARAVRLAASAGVGAGTVDTGLTAMAGVRAGASLAAGIRDAADAEMGIVFIDGSGNLTFHNRNGPVAKTTPDITIAADVCDPGTRFDVDMQGVLNYFESARVDGATQVVRNTLSELGNGTATNPGHGRYPGSASYLVQTDAEALDRGSWIVYTHAEPSPRLGALTIDLMSLDAATVQTLLTAEPDTWIRITGLPSQTPGGATADLMVQGFSDQLTKDSWFLTFNVANRALFPTPWILDSATFSVLDSTTRVFV